MRITPTAYISDWENQRRSWKERLFSSPFRPLQKYKRVKNPKLIKVADEIFCSFETADRLFEAVKDMENITEQDLLGAWK